MKNQHQLPVINGCQVGFIVPDWKPDWFVIVFYMDSRNGASGFGTAFWQPGTDHWVSGNYGFNCVHSAARDAMRRAQFDEQSHFDTPSDEVTPF